MPLDRDSQECQSFHTEEEVVSPTRVLHGQPNAVFYFQSSFQQLIIEHRDEILQWLDDLLGHAKTVPELLSLLRVLFEICRKFGIKLHAKKCLWFKTEVKWCGRIISKEGIRFDPRSRDALLQLSRPVTGGDLQQFLCALGWMRSSIPEFAKLVAPLQKLLERVYKKADGRTKQKAKRVPLSTIGWGQEEESCFEKVKHELQNSCTLAHLDNEKQLCLFTRRLGSVLGISVDSDSAGRRSTRATGAETSASGISFWLFRACRSELVNAGEGSIRNRRIMHPVTALPNTTERFFVVH